MAFSDILLIKAIMCGVKFFELRKNEKKMLEFIMNWNEIFTPVFFHSQYQHWDMSTLVKLTAFYFCYLNYMKTWNCQHLF